MSNLNFNNDGNDNYSLRGRVFHKIRDDILKGRYKQNQPLTEAAISKELGVSRTPVREALRQLELEGLVTSIPNRGVIVNGINSKDIKDIYEIRSLIEGLSAKWAAQNISKEQIEALEEVVYLSEFHLSKGHFDQLYELDNRFHELLYESSNSRILKHVLLDFHVYVQRVRRASLSSVERAEKSIREHKNIVEAIKQGDYLKVEALTNEHIINTTKNLADKKIVQELKIDE